MFTLKSYQANALAAVEAFFRDVRIVGRDDAWKKAHDGRGGSFRPYDASALGEVPSVCVRIPTGGGKTFLAANAAPVIGQRLLDTDAPFILWIVPSDAIRSQTLAALQTPRHPCREALEARFGQSLRVCALDELGSVGRHEIGASAVVVVATIQSFAVTDRSKRNVYSFDESLAAHFEGLTPAQESALQRVTPEDVAAQPYLTEADVGRVKSSLANLFVLVSPVVVVDEAHNNRTELAFRTLRGLNPAGVLELTATPAQTSNVLCHVSATELQQEEMIKLPIVLMEHPTGWQDAVRDAVLTRRRLELLAAKEDDYLRPVLLFQAEDRNGEATVEKLVEHLKNAEGENIDPAEIAVATGSQKELAGVDLADPACRVRYVVTVEALKEGWDRPFAYVLCSLQDSKSAKDVEQLLGRVLRMPYARARKAPELNRAYAHVVKTGFSLVAQELADRLVQNMGFNPYEAASAIVDAAQPGLPGVTAQLRAPDEAFITLPVAPTTPVPASLAAIVEVRPAMDGRATLVVKGGEIPDEVEAFALEAVPPKQREGVRQAFESERLRLATKKSPAMRGVVFEPLPMLCMTFENELALAERRLLAQSGAFDLFDLPIELPGFSIVESGSVFEIGLDEGKVRYQQTASAQLQLDAVTTSWTESQLVRWLDRECRQEDVAQPSMAKWMTKQVHDLMVDRGLSLTALVRARHQLKDAALREIERRRQLAVTKGFQTALPTFTASPRFENAYRYSFTFRADPGFYPARQPFYSGRYKFTKHYYAVIHDLVEKTSSGLAEEFLCAQAIDLHPKVKHWIRNVEREPTRSFWLPTATDRFYPDFVAELTDGRLLVVEYKGKHLDNDDTREKRRVGEQWAKTSDGRCLFLMAMGLEDDAGRDLKTRLDQIIAAGANH